MAVPIVQLAFQVRTGLIQPVVEGIFEIFALLEPVFALLYFQQMGIDKQPHPAIAPVGRTLIVRPVLRHQREHPRKVLFGFLNVLCSGFIFPLQGVTRSGETCHIDPVMVLVEVGGPTLAVGLAPVIQHDLCVMPDFVRHFFLLLAGKPGLEPVISQRQSKQNPGSRQVYIYQMGVAPFFIGKHGANKSLCLVQIFLVTAEAIGQRQIGDRNAHISCAFFGMFLRQDHRFIAIGLCKKPLILFFSLSRNFFAVGFQVSDKNQMARLISLFCLFFLCGPAALQPVLKGPYRTADTVLQSQTVLLESEPFQPGVPASD